MSRTLRSGDSGPDVVCLQEAINRDRESDIAVDGTYGTATTAAVRAFQGAVGLPVDGIAGPATLTRYGIWGGATDTSTNTSPPPSTDPPPSTSPPTAGAGCTVSRTLRAGNTGQDVVCLQEAINRDRESDIAVDGVYGSATSASIRAYQAAVGLPITGIANQATLQRYGIWGGGSGGGSGGSTPTPPPTAGAGCTVTRTLRRGDSGQDVVCLQEAINRDRESDIAVDGSYGFTTAAAVGGFQNAVGLPNTGVADQATLQRYGIWGGSGGGGGGGSTPTPPPTAGAGCTVSRTLRRGDSGQEIVCLQEAINRDRESDIAVDGTYGFTTAAAVGGFQNAVGLPNTAVADQATLQRYGIWGGASTPPPAPPPTAGAGCTVTRTLRRGDSGQDVVCLQEAINRDRESDIAVDGSYGFTTAAAVGGFQNAVGLPNTAVADQATLQRYGIWGGASTPPPAPPPSAGAGCTVSRTLQFGMTGQEIVCLQEAINRDRLSDILVDGRYGNATSSAVQAFQGALGLPITGSADPATLQRYGIWSGPDPSTIPAPSPSTGAQGLPANSGTGRRIVYSRSQQRLWAVDESGAVVKTHSVSGRTYEPYAGTYYVYSRSEYTYSAKDPSVRWRYMVRFAYGPQGGRIGFHEIPNRNGRPLQTKEQLGLPLSGGCVRQSTDDAIWLWNWAPIGTKVVVL